MVPYLRSLKPVIMLTMLLINVIRHTGASGQEAVVVMVESDPGDPGDPGDRGVPGDPGAPGGESGGSFQDQLVVVIDDSLPRHLCSRLTVNLEVRI